MFRYIGNKSKVLPVLLPIITDGVAPGGRIADLMCGTASVSAALRSAGFAVTAADQLSFPVHHAIVRLQLGQAPAFTVAGGYERALRILNELPAVPGYFVREYSDGGTPESGDEPRKYLSTENAARLDAMSSAVSAWHASGEIDDHENALLRHDLVLAVNRVANIAGTYGHYRSAYGTTSLKPIELRPSTFTADNADGHRVLQGNVEKVAGEVDADVLYLDPPYKKRQYAANYHLLETVARADEAPAIGKSGLRDWWPQYSDFCSKVKIGPAFAEVFDRSPVRRVMVSYSEDGLLSEQQMTDLLGQFGMVTTHRFPHSRFRSNASSLAPKLEELVFEVDRR